MTPLRGLSGILIAACAALALTAGCAHDVRERAEPDIVFHLVRHAEKATAPANDPELSATGRARAQRLAASLQEAPPTAIYSTDYARTRATASATAERYGRELEIYDARRPAAEFAEELRRRHVGGDIVLIVGHSNTVAPIAAALCRCEVPPLSEDEYDRWLTIRIAHSGEAHLRTTRY